MLQVSHKNSSLISKFFRKHRRRSRNKKGKTNDYDSEMHDDDSKEILFVFKE